MSPDITFVAALMADQARSRMLLALLSGKALTATELALEADITAQTASSHLSKLVEGQLLLVRKQGRHKYFQLQSLEVAQLLESLLNLSSVLAHPKARTGPADPLLRKSRVCYDHLAGEVGVGLYHSLLEQQLLTEHSDQVMLTKQGVDFFTAIGVNLTELEKQKRPLCKACLDWSERRTHLAGALGQWVLQDILNQGWAVRDNDSRVLHFHLKGMASFCKRYRFRTSNQALAGSD